MKLIVCAVMYFSYFSNMKHIDMTKNDSAVLWAKTLITMTASMAMVAKIAKHRSDLVAEQNTHPTIKDEIQESILDCDIILNRATNDAKNIMEMCADLMNEEEIVDEVSQKLYGLIK